MPFFDLPLDQLLTYKPDTAYPDDLSEFWQLTLAENQFDPGSVKVRPVESNLESIAIYDVTFGGFGGQPVSAWLLTPNRPGKFPTVVGFAGYGGGRGIPEEHLFWPSSGYALFKMDTRGQGSRWGAGGYTADGCVPAENAQVMTRGITSKFDYYYRRFFTDAHHAVEAAALMDAVDANRLATFGGSQGGAGSLAAASLNHRVQAMMADVPYMAHLRRAVGLTGARPYEEVSEYLSVKRDQVETVFETLSYFDVANVGRMAKAPGLFSVGLMDEIAPPSTVFAAKNWYGGDSEINVYQYNGHDGGGAIQLRAQSEWLRQRFLAS